MRNSYFLLFLLPLLTIDLQAQSGFEWGVSAYPNVSHRRLLARQAISEAEERELEERETARISLSAGGFIGWRGERGGFRAGLNFMDTGYRTVREPFPAGAPNPEEASEQRIVFRNFNLEIPLEIHFLHTLSRRDAFGFMMGLSASFNLANREETILYFGDTSTRSGESPAEPDFRLFNYGFISGLSYDRRISPAMAWFVQPHFQFWFQGILPDDANLNRNLYSLGIKTGVRFAEAVE